MKFIKQAILTILILVSAGILFRGSIYRTLVTYKSLELRTSYSATDEKLVEYINANAHMQDDLEIKDIIKLGLSITSKQLNFTAEKNDIDPNKLIASKAAHCVGYATFFSTTCNHLLGKYNLSDTWTAKPQVGEIFVLGYNIHKFSKSSFFKDHDFVTIENKTTGEIFAVDPAINDYLWIDFVSYEYDKKDE